MDRISAPPQNALLGRLADLLRLAETGAAGGPEFLPKSLDVMNLVRQLALPSAETVEKLSYGDPLFRMAPSSTGSRIPMTANREYLADVAGMVPFAAPAARPSARGMQDLVRQIQTEPPVGAISPEIAARVIPNTKVVDEAGNPKLLYHGTNKDYKQFSESMLGTKTGNPTSKLGYFFSGSPKEASRYAVDWGKEGGNVRPVYLDIKNPKRLTYKEMNDISMAMFDDSLSLPVNAWKTKEGKQAIATSKEKGIKKANQMAMDLRERLISEGYDGAVVRIGGQDEYIAFSPEQIRSATSDPQMAGLLGEPAQSVAETSYRGSHSAPSRDFGAQLHQLDQIFPDDIYSPQAARLYGHYGANDPMDRQTIRLAQSFRGKPDADVTIYRAVPKDEKIKGINQGDWVTINKQYAKEHGESVLLGDYKILEKKVKAKDIWTNADSIHEYGYDPD